jgi:hypothetical protein
MVMVFSLSQPDPAVATRIAKRFGSMRKLAAHIKKDAGTVSRTLRGELKAPETRKAIATALGMSQVKVFGRAA